MPVQPDKIAGVLNGHISEFAEAYIVVGILAGSRLPIVLRKIDFVDQGFALRQILAESLSNGMLHPPANPTSAPEE